MKKPSLSDQIAAVRREIDTLRSSYSERDGRIRDVDVLRDIDCLEAAVRTLRRVHRARAQRSHKDGRPLP